SIGRQSIKADTRSRTSLPPEDTKTVPSAKLSCPILRSDTSIPRDSLSQKGNHVCTLMQSPRARGPPRWAYDSPPQNEMKSCLPPDKELYARLGGPRARAMTTYFRLALYHPRQNIRGAAALLRRDVEMRDRAQRARRENRKQHAHLF